ncbi:MAG: hypothetical protein JWP08_339, partial [Bryobacterales bacterium]|nr:hypothetical protein [Bryobacterales bacterium]
MSGSRLPQPVEAMGLQPNLFIDNRYLRRTREGKVLEIATRPADGGAVRTYPDVKAYVRAQEAGGEDSRWKSPSTARAKSDASQMCGVRDGPRQQKPVSGWSLRMRPASSSVRIFLCRRCLGLLPQRDTHYQRPRQRKEHQPAARSSVP